MCTVCLVLLWFLFFLPGSCLVFSELIDRQAHPLWEETHLFTVTVYKQIKTSPSDCIIVCQTCCKFSSIFPELSLSRVLNISGWDKKWKSALSVWKCVFVSPLFALLPLTVEHFQFNETAYKVVEVYGVLSIGVTVDDGLQHRIVDLKPCRGENTCSYRSLSKMKVVVFWLRCSF